MPETYQPLSLVRQSSGRLRQRPVLGNQDRVPEKGNEKGAADEAPGMGPEGNAPLSAGQPAADELQEEPVAQHEIRRDHDPGYEDHENDEHMDPYPGVENDVGSHHSANGTGRTHHGYGTHRVCPCLSCRGGQPTQKVKGEIAYVPHRIFYVVPEDPEEPHVADEVEPATVEEHRAQWAEAARVAGDHAHSGATHREGESFGQSSEELTRNKPQLAHRSRQV